LGFLGPVHAGTQRRATPLTLGVYPRLLPLRSRATDPSHRPSLVVAVLCAAVVQPVHYTDGGPSECRGIAEFMSDEFKRKWHPHLLEPNNFMHTTLVRAGHGVAWGRTPPLCIVVRVSPSGKGSASSVWMGVGHRASGCAASNVYGVWGKGVSVV
jgi:hypothetical protein